MKNILSAFSKLIMAFIILSAPVTAQEKPNDRINKTNIEINPLGSLDVEASFIGVHNDALIVAGDAIWVATREGDALTWHDTGLSLPGSYINGASASHELGMFLIGGDAVQDDVFHIQWDSEQQKIRLLQLPDLPSTSINGAAAVLDNMLYVIAGSDGNLFSFDLSQIESAADAMTVSPWTKLPSIPQYQASTNIALQVQHDGRSEQLFAIGGENSEIWVYNPADAVWTNKGDISVDGNKIDISSPASIAISQSHILVIDDANQMALTYNTITNAWAALSGDLDVSDKTTALRWGDDIILATGGVEGPLNLSVTKVNGPTQSFSWQNIVVLIVYLSLIMLIGVYFSFKNKNTNDYFRGGQNIPWWAAGCSIYATMLSSLTYVAIPALVYRTDWVIYVGTLMILACAPIAIYITMPFFRQIDATSAYEYLSRRFNMPVRLFASGLFTLFHLGRMGIVFALTALALSAITPMEAWQSILLMGVLSLLYSTLGGIEAVIWTDTLQVVVLILGAVICFAVILNGTDGGFSGFYQSGMADDKFRLVNLDFSAGSIKTWSLWVIIVGSLGQNISSYSADQAVVQRYMTTKDTKAAAKSIWTNGLLAVSSSLLFLSIGTGLYSFYQSNPEKLDPTIQVDQIFPAFIATELPVGIAGIIIAGIFSAAQSTVSTSMNSMATTLVTDFMRPFNACETEKGYLNAARILTFLVGLGGTFAGLLFISPEILSLAEEYYKVIGMFMGALGGLFILGMFTRRANGWGALIGIFVGVGVMMLTFMMDWADGYLFATIGILTSMAAGYLASLLLPSDHTDLEGLTLYTMGKSHDQ